MADTVRTIAQLLSVLFADGQPAGSLTPQDARDLIVSVSPPEVTLTPAAAAIAWDLSVNPVVQATLTDASTTITLANGETGRSYRMALIQGSGGSKAAVLAGCTVLGSPLWQTAAGAVNIVTVDVVGATRYAVVA